ncbi:MAG: DUF1499 domain-containing protein [Pseudomonadota bacterium]
MDRVRRILGYLVFMATAVSVVLGLLTGPGYRAAFWSLRTSVEILYLSSYFAIAAGGLALIWGLLCLSTRSWARAFVSTSVIALSLAFVLGLRDYRSEARNHPPIHDVTTDFDDKPAFVKLSPRDYGEEGLIVPDGGRKDLEPLSPTERLRRWHEEVYADVNSLVMAGDVGQITNIAAQTLRGMRLSLAAVVPEQGRVEAIHTSRWYGFRDDVVVRVRPLEAPCKVVVDVRSVSRIGVSDLGANGARIRRFLREMADIPAVGCDETGNTS